MSVWHSFQPIHDHDQGVRVARPLSNRLLSRMQKGMPLVEFSKRFCHRVLEHGQPVTWFLGAGCSISSGIPGAGALTLRWLGELREMQSAKVSLEVFASREFPGFDRKDPAVSYAPVFSRRHPAPAERQREIERICAKGNPSYGYATLAQILAHPTAGALCNTVLTTNFDDLIADALYLYGHREKRPQIITHDALARYMSIRSTRPTVVKLHGDAMFDPRNLEAETEHISDDLAQNLYPILQDSALVFVGYGGNDRSVCSFLRAFLRRGLSHPVFWVGTTEPCSEMGKWLDEKGAQRVLHRDFDRLMHVLRGELGIPLVSKEDWLLGWEQYVEQFQQFERNIEADPEGSEKAAMRRASSTAESTLSKERKRLRRATALQWDDPRGAQREFKKALAEFPTSVLLHAAYASFVFKRLGDIDTADKMFQTALQLSPEDVQILNDYSAFLWRGKRDFDEAERCMLKVLAGDPRPRSALDNYASFLWEARNKPDQAEEVYQRCIAEVPDPYSAQGNYAEMLFSLGRRNEALAQLNAAEAGAREREDMLRLAVFGVYRLAHDPDNATLALADIEKAISGGVVTRHLTFASLHRAAEDGCKDVDFVRMLGDVLSAKVDAAELNKFPAWISGTGRNAKS